MNESIEIIVSEETEDIQDYYRVLDEEFNRHGKCVKEFCDKYGISLTFQDIGVEEGNFNGYLWSRGVTILGNLVIQNSREYIVIYLPLKISHHQYQRMKCKKSWFRKFRDKIVIYSYFMEDGKVVEEALDQFYEEDMVEVLYERLKDKKVEMEEKNVSRTRNR